MLYSWKFMAIVFYKHDNIFYYPVITKTTKNVVIIQMIVIKWYWYNTKKDCWSHVRLIKIEVYFHVTWLY